MSIAKITLIGCENFLNDKNDSLFTKLVLPEGIDKDTLVNNILLNAGEFEVLYSNPYFMQRAVELWSDKHLRTFEKWIYALSQDYEPLYNYDRHEEWSDSNQGDATASASTNTEMIADSKKNTYDSDSLHLTGEDVANNTANNSSESEYKSKNDHTGHIYGNIGITTSSAMLNEYLQMQSWNIYEHITDLFVTEFCLLVYE